MLDSFPQLSLPSLFWALSVSTCNKSLIIKVSLIGAVLGEYKSFVFFGLKHDPHSQYLRTISPRPLRIFSSQKYGSALGCFRVAQASLSFTVFLHAFIVFLLAATFRRSCNGL